ncbi:hypothetical protein SAMN05421810_10170 [Amycolatopsis arida]|uniref:Uncharacterized protein n=1 Tax=Amycolatopsis arida TaxID=587909 RepID=A0A1I5KAS1_9PSEU|nr:hypothetical protein [Amycolatopsis arida]TDX96966.1 hypothetical protein CLV69_10268 [Amycolatopsis arida]SFO82172.1 hypothetical protein SAMN05421810_10170 [Amycolatopsis arida]
MVSLGASATSAYDPWAVQSRVGLTDARLALDSVLMPRPNLSYIDYRSGVMASGDTGGQGGSSHMAMRVRPASSGLAVTVEMGNAVINTPGMGAYMCALDSRKTLTLAPSSATTNRVDLVIARVYDDLNPVIASAPGERKFVVEVWQGDPATGTPAVPTPTPTDGWTPLAAVTVAKGATAITTANIRDLRGPGLVARGGMRALYGEDARPTSEAFQEPGAYPGDQRWVHSAGFQHQVYYGANADGDRSGWRGVFNAVRYTANPPSSGYIWTAGYGATRELCRLTVRYPGTPYMIYASARGFLTLSPGSAADLRINIGSHTGPDVNWTRFTNYGTSGDKDCVPNVAPIMYGVFTGDATVVLSCGMRDNESIHSGFGFRGNDQTILTVVAFPSTIQPPEL